MSFGKLITFGSVLVSVSAAGNKFSRHTELDNYTFGDYLKQSGKRYASHEEMSKRLNIFSANLKKIRTFNAENHSWKMGVNRFTDMTNEEVMQFSLGGDKNALHTNEKKVTSVKDNLKGRELPASVDWRNIPNVISAVKDQGQCGSCWAFAAAETIEAHVAINTGILNEISMQELVSCMDNSDNCGGTGGCQGATAELAFDYLAQYGLPENWVYGYLPDVYWNSYTGTNGECLRDQSYTKNGVTQSAVPRFATGSGYVLLPRNDYGELMNAVAHIGPMAVNIDASNWHFYESGVFSGCPQEDVDINHVVQLVGYGTTAEGSDYWTIRNSWSPEWGEEGYIRLARSDGYCGIDYHNGDGVGCDYDPTNVTVCGMCGILYDSSYPTDAGLA